MELREKKQWLRSRESFARVTRNLEPRNRTTGAFLVGTQYSVYLGPLFFSPHFSLPRLSAPSGYVRLRLRDPSSPLRKYATDGYLNPEVFRSSWCFSLVTKVINEMERDLSLDVKLVVRSHGPAVELDIIEKSSGKVSELGGSKPSSKNALGLNTGIHAKPYDPPTHQQFMPDSEGHNERSIMAVEKHPSILHWLEM